MKKITSEHFSEDDNLVKFLQTYEPVPPSEIKPCEELIMRSISLASAPKNIATRKKRAPSKLFWLVPITVIATVITISNQWWRNNQPSPQMLSTNEEMDRFMINTWQGSVSHEPEEDYLYINSSY